MTDPSDTPTRKRRRPPPEVSEAALRQSALGYLERYATSSAHLKRVLLIKVERWARFHGSDREDSDREEGVRLVDQVVAKLVAAGLLDDRAYAASMTRAWHRRGTSAKAIRAKLASKGVASALAAAALADLAEEGGDPELAAAVAYARRRRLGPYRAPERREPQRERDLAALARAGFSYDLAHKVIEAADPVDLEDLLAERSA